jgi:tetratricopeptide (TPR) repeat protein
VATSINKQTTIAISVALALGTVLLYLPITGNDFVSFDDHQYILDNPHVKAGLTVQGVLWAFRTGYASNWHPLTWLSHMLDCQVFGLDPTGHHLVNLLLHSANSVLLFLLLLRMTGATWRSGAVAAFFAWHPLHVESVAWASERKDVLSTLFWLLTMLAYVRYVRELDKPPGPSRDHEARLYRGLALGCFLLGLMSKPMLVTAPFVLLLLDYWPLRRFTLPQPRTAADQAEASKSEAVSRPAATLRDLIVEKTPFFILAAAACVVTYAVQSEGGAAATLGIVPVSARIANALVAYARYLKKTVWPAHLAAIYPYVKHLPAGTVLEAAVVLLAFSIAVVVLGRRRPWLIVGWLWFLGTLVPTIGLVQVGSQSMADRYMYVPAVGLFIIAVWGAASLLESVPGKSAVLGGLAAVTLGGCMWVTHVQMSYWRNTVALCSRALEVTTNNYIAYNGLGGALDQLGQKDKALALYYKTVATNPRFSDGQYNLGTALIERGDITNGLVHLRAALESDPYHSRAHENLGKALLEQGKVVEAKQHLDLALSLDPDAPENHYNLGTFLLDESHVEEAIGQFQAATELKPDYADAYDNLGIAFMRLGKVREGLDAFSQAVVLEPKNAQDQFNFGVALLAQNMADGAAACFSQAVKLQPDNPRFHHFLALACEHQLKPADAIAEFRESLRLKPGVPDVMIDLAWVLATTSDAKLRDGAEAVRLAEHTCTVAGRRDPANLETLAAAYAEAGRFPDAVATASEAQKLAEAAGRKATADRCANLLKLFQSGKPFRQ